MKLLDKLKNAIFEDEEEFNEDLDLGTPKKEEKEEPKEEIVKQIDIEKTIPKKIDLSEEIKKEEQVEKPILKREQVRKPIIFDDEDFMEQETSFVRPKPIKKEVEPKKPLYGGYRDEKTKEKFKPSPNISPVYGLVGEAPSPTKIEKEPLEKHIYVEPKKEEISLDEVRHKAYGENYVDEDENQKLLYEMKNEESPAISKITLGDAEEYYEDLGLEYNVDYKDEKKTRSTKNEELTKVVEEEIENTKDLEITKEQIKPKTAKEIKENSKMEEEPEIEEVDEKNLYDLIDMMYESK